MKRNLIVYASRTGNTEKVAHELAKNFERYGWTNELKKLADDYDAEHPDFSFDDYDFACVGSPRQTHPRPQMRHCLLHIRRHSPRTQRSCSGPVDDGG